MQIDPHDRSVAMHYTVYLIINNINGMLYIGQHSTPDPFDNYLGSGVYISMAHREYGRKNFTKEILFDYDNFDEMNDKERELVDKDFVGRNDTYNTIPGGTGSIKRTTGMYMSLCNDRLRKTIMWAKYKPIPQSMADDGWRVGCYVTEKMKQKHYEHTAKFEYDGCMYTLEEICDKLGLHLPTIHTRIWAYKWDFYRAISEPIHTKELKYDYDGKSMTLIEWSKHLGIKLGTLRDRVIKNKWPLEKAFTTATRVWPEYEYNGESHTLECWGKLKGCSGSALKARMNSGLTFKEAFELPFTTEPF